ncbi:MAG: serine protease [Thermosynechococcaceae cyanobacterium]
MTIPHSDWRRPFKGLIIILAAVSFAPDAAALPASEVSKIAQGVTVTVLIDEQNFGSGVLLNRQGNTYTVLTAEHVVPNISAAYKVITPDQVSHPVNGQTIKKMPGVDLAVVQFNSDRPYSVAKMGNSDTAVIGSVVHVAGFPAPGRAIQDREFTFTTGEISARPAKAQADGYALVYTNVTRRGMSGGPVIDSDGRLVGIHGRAEADGDSGSAKAGLNLGIPIKTFTDLARTMGLKIDVSPNTAKASPPPVPAASMQSAQPSLPEVSPPAFQSSPASTLSPALLYSRPKPIRPTSSSTKAPICAGSSC